MTPAAISARATEGLCGLCLLFGFQLLGEGVVWLARLPFPGSVIGMLLLVIALRWNWARPEWLRLASRTLLFFLPLLFVPLCVILFHPPPATVATLMRYGLPGLFGTLLLLLGVPVTLFIAFSALLGRREKARKADKTA